MSCSRNHWRSWWNRFRPRAAGDAIASGRLYVLPGHDSEVDVNKAKAIANGRATGIDAYPPIVASILRSLQRADSSIEGSTRRRSTP